MTVGQATTSCATMYFFAADGDTADGDTGEQAVTQLNPSDEKALGELKAPRHRDA
jgi:hypothetical protein